MSEDKAREKLIQACDFVDWGNMPFSRIGNTDRGVV